MRFTGVVGVVLIVLGVVVLAARGISYTKERHSTDIGPLQVSTEKKGFVSPAAGAIAIVAGIVLVAVGRRNSV
jgi:Na+-transporting methylmalonyl-CoA/oxaloacetate decarboxylase gamma subunit